MTKETVVREVGVLAVVAALTMPACWVAGVETDREEAVLEFTEPAPVEVPAKELPPIAVEPPAPDDPDGAARLDVDLADEYGCGHGVWIGSADQQVALHVAYVGVSPEGPLPDAVLPDPAWDVRVQIGRDLFANWCDDVLEPGEPTPQVAQEWVGAEGTIRVVERPTSGCPTTVVIEVTGLLTQRPNGRMVRIPDVTVTNDSWGCFAG